MLSDFNIGILLQTKQLVLKFADRYNLANSVRNHFYLKRKVETKAFSMLKSSFILKTRVHYLSISLLLGIWLKLFVWLQTSGYYSLCVFQRDIHLFIT